MDLKIAVDEILTGKNRSFAWLATAMDKTPDGLKLALVNQSIKYKDLILLIDVLEVPVTAMFEKKYNSEAETAMAKEPESGYKREVEVLRENISLLKSTINDKNRIIEMLSAK